VNRRILGPVPTLGTSTNAANRNSGPSAVIGLIVRSANVDWPWTTCRPLNLNAGQPSLQPINLEWYRYSAGASSQPAIQSGYLRSVREGGKSSLRDKEERKPTIIDVAKEARMGVMTVSRVINDHPGVRPKTKSRVMAAINRVGYRPNEAARILKGARRKTIALVVPDLSDFFATSFHAIQAVAMQHGYQTIVVATGRSALVESEQIEAMSSQQIAGLLMVTSGGNVGQLQKMQSVGVPVIALDRPIRGIDADVVLIENREGAERGVEHLIGHKFKRIACVGFDAGAYTVAERLDGYRRIVLAAGLKPIIFETINSLDEMKELVTLWSQRDDRPDAVFTLQRISSIRLVQALHGCSIRVPEDIAVVGFDDFELADVLSTPLTVVAQSPSEMGRRAATLLFQQIEASRTSEAREVPIKLVLPTRLIVRASCGCVGKS